MCGKINYIDFFSFHISTFKLIGFWKPDEGMEYKKLYNLYTFLCTTIWTTFLISQFIYIFGSFDNIDELTDVSYVAMTCTIDLIKMLAIYKNMDLIKSLLKKMNKPLFQPKCEEHYVLAMSVKKFHKTLFYFCLYIGLQTYIFFSAIPFLRVGLVPLTQGWFPVDFRYSPNYEIIYIFQNVVILWNTLIFLNLDTFTSGLMMQVGLQCDYLSVTLNSLHKFHVIDTVLCQNDEDLSDLIDTQAYTDVMTQNLVVCIKHYRGIKELSRDIEDIHNTSVFILFLGGSMIICFALFQLCVVELGGIEFFLFVSFLLCMLMEQFMYCWFGNEIIYKSGMIFSSAYNTPWLDCDKKFQKILLNFMTQIKSPIGLKAGGLFTMSISVFVSVLRSSYSYLTLLQRMQEKETIE